MGRLDRTSLRRDRRAQMMLLTAVLLIIGFFALAGMVARINQLSTDTLREQDAPILNELDQVAQVVDALVAAHVENTTATPELENNITASLKQLERMENARGYTFEATLVCDAGNGRVQVVLGDQQTRLIVLSTQTFTRTGC